MSNMSFEEMIIILLLFVAVIIIAGVIINLKEKEISMLNESHNLILEQYHTSIARHQAALKEKSDRIEELEKEKRDEKQSYWVTINELEFENQKLKAIIEKYEKENVSRETSYNQSFGMPEVIDYFDQQYAREETKRG